MIHVFHRLDLGYDSEIERNDIYLYEAPDGFAFDDALVVKFLNTKRVTKTGDINLCWLMRDDTSSKRDGIGKGEFLEWLKTQGVRLVEYKMICGDDI